jgi:hypothetical protein
LNEGDTYVDLGTDNVIIGGIDVGSSLSKREAPDPIRNPDFDAFGDPRIP